MPRSRRIHTGTLRRRWEIRLCVRHRRIVQDHSQHIQSILFCLPKLFLLNALWWIIKCNKKFKIIPKTIMRLLKFIFTLHNIIKALQDWQPICRVLWYRCDFSIIIVWFSSNYFHQINVVLRNLENTINKYHHIKMVAWSLTKCSVKSFKWIICAVIKNKFFVFFFILVNGWCFMFQHQPSICEVQPKIIKVSFITFVIKMFFNIGIPLTNISCTGITFKIFISSSSSMSLNTISRGIWNCLSSFLLFACFYI